MGQCQVKTGGVGKRYYTGILKVQTPETVVIKSRSLEAAGAALKQKVLQGI